MILGLFIAACVLVVLGLSRIYLRFGLVRLLVGLVVGAAIVVAIGLVARLTGCGVHPHPALVESTLGGQGWLTHPRGFAFREPGPGYIASDEIDDELESPWTTCYKFAKRPTGKLTVCAIDVDIETRADFAAQIKGARRGLEESMSAFSHGTVVTDDVEWVGGKGTAFIHVVLESGVDARLKAYTIDGGIAIMYVFASSSDELADVVTSFTRR